MEELSFAASLNDVPEPWTDDVGYGEEGEEETYPTHLQRLGKYTQCINLDI